MLARRCGDAHPHKARPLTSEQQALSVPDRFKQLREVGTGSLRSSTPSRRASPRCRIGSPMRRQPGRGGLLVMRGDPGAGKSTFLETVGLFLRGVVTERIPGDTNVAGELSNLSKSVDFRVVAVEGREALRDVGPEVLEVSSCLQPILLRVSGGSVQPGCLGGGSPSLRPNRLPSSDLRLSYIWESERPASRAGDGVA